MSPDFTPRDPAYEARIRRSFSRQPMMATLGVAIDSIRPGAVDLSLPVSPGILQQHGFVHMGAVSTLADTACGFSALTLMPEGAGVLTVEFKMNMMAPAAGERLLARGRVVKAGRTLIVTLSDVYALADGRERAIALMTATMMTIEGRDGIVD